MSDQIKIDALTKHDPAKMALSIVADVTHTIMAAIENGQDFTYEIKETEDHPAWLGGPCDIHIKVLPK